MRGSQDSERKWSGPSKGGFRLNGSVDEEGSPDTPISKFIRQVWHDRKTTTVSPAEVVLRIPQPFAHAFPCRSQWERCEDWADARCESSAESSIVYAFRSRSGEPRPRPDSPEETEALLNGGYFANVSHVADRINRGCLLHGITDPYDPRRIAMHRVHGELVAKGITDPQEIIRVIAHNLKELCPAPIVVVEPGG
jgi:hypothetical protein